MIGTNTGISVRCVLVIQPKGVSENQLVAEDGPRGYWLEADNQNREYRPENRLYVNASCRQSERCLDVLSFLPFGIMRSYPGFCRRKQLEYNSGLTHRRRAGHPRANRRTSDRPSFHAPLAGCDRLELRFRHGLHRFQSTHPLRGATAKLPKYSRQICEKATKFLQSQTKSGVAACWAKGKRPLFPALRGANLPGKTGTLPVRIR